MVDSDQPSGLGHYSPMNKATNALIALLLAACGDDITTPWTTDPTEGPAVGPGGGYSDGAADDTGPVDSPALFCPTLMVVAGLSGQCSYLPYGHGEPLVHGQMSNLDDGPVLLEIGGLWPMTERGPTWLDLASWAGDGGPLVDLVIPSSHHAAAEAAQADTAATVTVWASLVTRPDQPCPGVLGPDGGPVVTLPVSWGLVHIGEVDAGNPEIRWSVPRTCQVGGEVVGRTIPITYLGDAQTEQMPIWWSPGVGWGPYGHTAIIH